MELIQILKEHKALCIEDKWWQYDCTELFDIVLTLAEEHGWLPDSVPPDECARLCAVHDAAFTSELVNHCLKTYGYDTLYVHSLQY